MAAATTVYNTLFGAAGVSDAQMFHPGLVSIKRTIDFSKTNVEDGKAFAILGLPKSFVALGTFFESDADKDGGYPAANAITLKVADASDGDNDITIGSFTPSNSAYKRETSLYGYTGTVASTTATITGGPKVFDSGAIVNINVASADATAGVVTVCVFGFVPDGDSLGNIVTPAPRAAEQATATQQTNVGVLDPYYGK